MNLEQLKKDAVIALETVWKFPSTVSYVETQHLQEKERLEKMLTKAEENPEEANFLSSGDLGYTLNKYEPIAANEVYALTVRGSDIRSGSFLRGYADRHPELKSRLEKLKNWS